MITQKHFIEYLDWIDNSLDYFLTSNQSINKYINNLKQSITSLKGIDINSFENLFIDLKNHASILDDNYTSMNIETNLDNYNNEILVINFVGDNNELKLIINNLKKISITFEKYQIKSNKKEKLSNLEYKYLNQFAKSYIKNKKLITKFDKFKKAMFKVITTINYKYYPFYGRYKDAYENIIIYYKELLKGMDY